MNFRMLGLTAAVMGAALLPLVASAGPLGPSPASRPVSGPPGAANSPEAATMPVRAAVRASVRAAGPTAEAVPEPAAPERCGPEVGSPEGVEAQTCVVSGEGSGDASGGSGPGSGAGGDTWGRTYYRNASGAELLLLLSLMGPRGRTVQTHCEVPEGSREGTCETPHEATRGKRSDYLAIAEFAARGADGGAPGDGPLVLRSGSNSPGPEAG
ncbi:hypothetical protein AB0O07_31385 [Streptomyces sp. NPDC093085]|uniref:hypothetical protein n=1 Tax=Streptomyces sp. NPDC093085 TaxID=3155068 RepID=UPI00343CC15D